MQLLNSDETRLKIGAISIFGVVTLLEYAETPVHASIAAQLPPPVIVSREIWEITTALRMQ